MTEESKICSVLVHEYSHCFFPAKVQRDGKWYCTRHDPEYLNKKKETEYQRNFKNLKSLTTYLIKEIDKVINKWMEDK
jgi:hypothetical protein